MGPDAWPTRDVLSHRVASTPDRTAVVDAETADEWTYRAFDGLVEDIAGGLAPLAHDTDRIGLLAATTVGFFATVHAGFRLGRTVVPLDTQLTDGELRERIQRVDIDVLVCDGTTESTAASVADCPVVSLDPPTMAGVEAVVPGEVDGGVTPGDSDVAPEDRNETALVLFTSGTTGDPKGVRLTHENLLASATASAFRLGVSTGDRWLCCLPAYHMGGLAPGIRCPLYGTTLVVGGHSGTAAIADALSSFEVTGVSLVPTQLKRLLADGWAPPASLETVLLGGAPASDDLIERALAAGVPVYPTYGTTETASQIATATPGDAEAHPGTVGQPLVVTDVTVVDDAGEPVDAGETGELVVDGPTVTPGYLDEGLVGDGGFHTGDVGYRDADGRLWIVGRADDTIVTGGENVHPAEVEDVLVAHPAVTDAAVVGLDDEEWGQRVATLVAPSTVDPEKVESFARERLAAYKLPKTIRSAERLPRTASGTVDREAVRERLS